MPRPLRRRPSSAAAVTALLAALGPARVPAAAQPAAADTAPSVDFRHGALRVAPDGRHLVHADGTAFFWLGDTAWELFHRLSRAETERYLEDRRRKGFTVVQAVVLAEYGGLDVPNAEGALPLEGNDPTRPNEAYFRHVDWAVDAAARRGLYVGMLPTWGDKWNKKWGTGPEIFTPANARAYGFFLGRRYRDKPVVWILGGDRSPERPADFAVIRAMAEGLRAGDGGAHLITYHPQGDQSSAQYFHGDPWLAFDMFQSGHMRRDIANDRFVDAARALAPAKPVVDGEPRYEDHPINWDPKNGWFDEADVRQAAYWAVLAGAAGHTYGDHNIWQFWQPGRAPVSAARTPWTVALGHPGSAQMGHLRRLFESRPFLLLEPDQGLVDVAAADTGPARPRAARAGDSSYAFAYTPLGRALRVRLDRLRGAAVRASWFDPREGTSAPAGTWAARGVQTFTPPGPAGRGRDWVLVLDGGAGDVGAKGVTHGVSDGTSTPVPPARAAGR